MPTCRDCDWTGGRTDAARGGKSGLRCPDCGSFDVFY